MQVDMTHGPWGQEEHKWGEGSRRWATLLTTDMGGRKEGCARCVGWKDVEKGEGEEEC